MKPLLLITIMSCLFALNGQAYALTYAEVEAQMEQGYAAHDDGRFDEAIALLEGVLPALPPDSTELIADVCSTLLDAHGRLGQLEQALVYGERCLRIDEQSGNKEGLSSSLNNLASVCLSAHRLTDAESFLLRAIAIERELKRDDKLAIRLGMLSEVYTSMKCPDKALPLAQEALTLDQEGGRLMKAAIRMSQLGNVLVCLHRPAEAMPYLTEALQLHQQYNNVPSQVITMVSLGMASHGLGQWLQAQHYLQECISLAQKSGQVKPLMSAHQELSVVYNEQHDPRAYDHVVQYVQLKDSLESVQVQRQISDLQVRYQTFQKEQELLQKDLIIGRQRAVYIALTIALLLLLSLAFFLFRLVRLKDQNLKLKDQMMQLISHDLKNPAIAQQKMLHQLCRALPSADQDTLQTLAKRMTAEADAHVGLLYSLLDWTRLQTGRMSFSPTRLNLLTVLQEVMEQHQVQADAKQVRAVLDSDESEHTIWADRQMVAAMLRNLLSNAIKFSDVLGEVHIFVQGPCVKMVNQGVDLYAESADQGSGLGLRLVQQLAEINHVDFVISSNDDVGTQATLRFATHA